MSFSVTSHTIVKNEERWIKAGLLSVIDYIQEMLVWDTGSTDKTVEIIKSIKNPKIKFKEVGKVTRRRLVKLRNQQIKETEADWFLLLDGDEIWPKKNLLKLFRAAEKSDKKTIALVNRTRNCIGDIYHYLPESKGRYQIGHWRGHLNIRIIRNLPGLVVVGEYPLETYLLQGVSLQKQVARLKFVDTWYLHLTHLKRSGWWHQLKTIDRIRKFKFFGKGIRMRKEELPEALRNIKY